MYLSKLRVPQLHRCETVLSARWQGYHRRHPTLCCPHYMSILYIFFIYLFHVEALLYHNEGFCYAKFSVHPIHTYCSSQAALTGRRQHFRWYHLPHTVHCTHRWWLDRPLQLGISHIVLSASVLCWRILALR